MVVLSLDGFNRIHRACSMTGVELCECLWCLSNYRQDMVSFLIVDVVRVHSIEGGEPLLTTRCEGGGQGACNPVDPTRLFLPGAGRLLSESIAIS